MAPKQSLQYATPRATVSHSHHQTYDPDDASILGTKTDLTWRDSYIRLKITRIQKLKLKMPLIDVGTSTNTVTDNVVNILTYGQLPVQVKSNQLILEYVGTLEADKFISLAAERKISSEQHDAGGFGGWTNPDTGIAVNRPNLGRWNTGTGGF